METKRNGTKKEALSYNRKLKLKHRVHRCFACVMLTVAFMPCVGAFALAATPDSLDPDGVPKDVLMEEDLSLATPLAATYPASTIAVTTAATTALTSTTTTTTSFATTTSATTTTTSAAETAAPTEVAVAETEVTEEYIEEVVEEVAEIEAPASEVGCCSACVSDDELVMLAKTLAQEAGDCSYTQQCCVIWTVLNRVASWEWPNTVSENLLYPDQFAYYSWKEYRPDHYQTVCDAVAAWENGNSLLGPDYQYFYGDGWRNHFYGKNSSEYVPD